MSEIFESYEQDFKENVNQIQKMIANISNLKQDKKEKELNDIKLEFTQADQLIKSMEIEINTLNIHTKQQFQQKIKKCRNEWDQLRKKYVKLEESHQDQKRRESLTDSKIELSTIDSNGKERFIKTGAMMSDGSYKLKGVLREIYQIETSANQVSINIYDQNKQFDKMIQDNVEIQSDLNGSDGTVERMKRNMRKNKIVLWLISFIIILAVLLIVWVRF